MNDDGTGQTPLTSNTAQDRHPDEQPLVSGGGDTTPPVLNTPSTVSANATSPAGAAVTYW